jgi:hypothetical protein
MFCHIFCQNLAPRSLHYSPNNPDQPPEIFPSRGPWGVELMLCSRHDRANITSPLLLLLHRRLAESLTNVALRMEIPAKPQATGARQAFVFLCALHTLLITRVFACRNPPSKCPTALQETYSAPQHSKIPTVLRSTPRYLQCSAALQDTYSAPQHSKKPTVLHSTPTVFKPKTPISPSQHYRHSTVSFYVFISRVPPHHSLFKGCPTP